MRKFLIISTIIIIGAALGYSFMSAHKSATPKQESSLFKEERGIKEGPEANEDFFLIRSYPDAYVNTHAYETALKDAYNRSNTIRNDQPWTLEGPENIGGRINCVAVDPDNPNVIYVGNASGGIFKTTDGGTSWSPVFDDQPYLAIGAITIDPNNSQVIWAGTGDLNISGYPFIGDGVYKSTDGGITWINMGLTETRIISKIIIDPSNSDIVYASTMGIPFETTTDRGLYKSTDGGTTWTNILYVDDDAGIIDMVMDPNDPQVLYAASWNRIRNNQVTIVSGPDAHIYKSTDGGSNWTILGGGLPQDMCRIGVAISKQNSNKLYALFVDTVNYQAYGIYKSTNGGTSWTNITGNFDQNLFGTQGWYFGKIYVNPTNDEEIYVPGVDMQKSTAGGNSWTQSTPDWWLYEVHADGHFIEFIDGNSLLYCTDGGMYRTDNDCSSWSDAEDIPNTQFYHVTVNPHYPEDYFGGAQDNGTMSGNAITVDSWNRIYGGDGFKPIFDPLDPDLFYTETQYGGMSYTTDGGFNFNDFTNGIDGSDRIGWDVPYLMSPENHTRFYCATHRVYKMTGAPFGTWVAISGDLTDGPISEDRFHVITTLSQSPLDENVLYAGTSDANVWSSINGGSVWNDITAGTAERYVTSVQASPNDANTVYVTNSGYRDGDYVPHVFKSTNNGQAWTDISGDLPQMAVNDILIQPGNENLLFVATDAGVYYTQNGGVNWTRLGNNMPMMAVYDVELNTETNKLIAGTFARSIWTIDVGAITGVQAAEGISGDISIYPNPVDGILSIKSCELMKGTVSIFNSDGVLVFSEKKSSESISIPVHELPGGIYFVKIEGEKFNWSGKFVKASE